MKRQSCRTACNMLLCKTKWKVLFAIFKFRTAILQLHVCIEYLVHLCFLWGVCSCISSSLLLWPHVCQTTGRSEDPFELVHSVYWPLHHSRERPLPFQHHRACALLWSSHVSIKCLLRGRVHVAYSTGQVLCPCL